MTPSYDQAEFDALCSRIADGIQTAADEQRLRELLATDPENRRRFRRVMWLHSSLHWAFASVAARAGLSTNRGSTPTRAGWGRGRWAAAALLAAVVGGGGLAGVAAWTSGLRSTAAAPLAVVTKTCFLDTTAAGEPLVAGRPFPGRTLEILGGAVAIRLSSGVDIVLEGPGSLDLHSDMQAAVRSGSVVVKMPEGRHGFRLETPAADVFDLGTEFAVKVGPDMLTDVQVYDGAVLAAVHGPANGFPRRLDAGKAMRFSPDQAAAVDMPYEETRFVRRLPDDRGAKRPTPGEPHPEADAREALRQFGRAEHAAVVVTRPAATVKIDGRLDDWPDAPGFQAWLGGDRSAAERVAGWMMYDAERLYIAAHVGDPAPLANRFDPTIDPESGWRGGSVQVRLSADRGQGWPVDANAASYYRMRRLAPTAAARLAATNSRLSHLTMWYHAPTHTPCLTIVRGMLTGPPLVNPAGFAGAYSRDADGRGYVLEYSIPWSLLDCGQDPPQPGDVLATTWQVHFSDSGGRLWRNQIIEIRNPDEPQRIFTWERAATWGRADYR